MFLCPAANPDALARTVMCQAAPERCAAPSTSAAADPGGRCDGLVCTAHGCQRADWHTDQLYTAPCPACRKTIALRRDGTLRGHGPWGNACPGSHRPPAIETIRAAAL